jgi:deoxyribodipyrimidine photo-lyase
MSTNRTHIHWFGNDLRLTDQPFAQKANDADILIGIYILDSKRIEYNQWGFRNMSLKRLQVLREHLIDLEQNLAKLGIPLIVKYGHPEEIIPEILTKYDASLSFMKEYATDESNGQFAVLEKLKGTDILYYDGNFMFDLQYVDWNDRFPGSFSKFRKKAEKHLKNTEYNLHPSLKDFGKDVYESLKKSQRKIDENCALPFIGGETEGRKRLKNYFFETKNASKYKETRNGMLGKDYSTKFSYWLAVGGLTPSIIMRKLREYEQVEGSNKSTYWIFFELLWRDWFRHACKYYRNQFFFKSETSDEIWKGRNSEIVFEEWVQAKTKKDFINANMVELRETGFMSNRGRQNVASYFTHDQAQDWRKGAAFFENQLIDYDVYSNTGNWQYITGVAFNPKGAAKFDLDFQANRYDANGKYREKWLKKE